MFVVYVRAYTNLGKKKDLKKARFFSKFNLNGKSLLVRCTYTIHIHLYGSSRRTWNRRRRNKYLYANVCMFMYTSIYRYMCVHTYRHVYICVYIHVYIYTCIYVSIYIPIYMCTCIYVSIYIPIYMCTYTHPHNCTLTFI